VTSRVCRDAHLTLMYLRAKRHVIASGFGSEIVWQSTRDVKRVTEATFLKEAAWVVLCSGFRESIVRARFDAVSVAFLNWTGAAAIVAGRVQCRRKALRAINARRKIDAILEIARRVCVVGFVEVASRLRSDPLSFIGSLPFMGSVTTLHLAKNLGVPVAKPDRHLVRLAAAAGCASASDLCERIASVIDEKIAVVDLVMWRYATLERSYSALLQSL
jgi:hypothetical protein